MLAASLARSSENNIHHDLRKPGLSCVKEGQIEVGEMLLQQIGECGRMVAVLGGIWHLNGAFCCAVAVQSLTVPGSQAQSVGVVMVARWAKDARWCLREG